MLIPEQIHDRAIINVFSMECLVQQFDCVNPLGMFVLRVWKMHDNINIDLAQHLD